MSLLGIVRHLTSVENYWIGDIGDVAQLGAGRPVPIREVLVHLIREYAQHLGHADLLRERIDGRVGQ